MSCRLGVLVWYVLLTMSTCLRVAGQRVRDHRRMARRRVLRRLHLTLSRPSARQDDRCAQGDKEPSLSWKAIRVESSQHQRGDLVISGKRVAEQRMNGIETPQIRELLALPAGFQHHISPPPPHHTRQTLQTNLRCSVPVVGSIRVWFGEVGLGRFRGGIATTSPQGDTETSGSVALEFLHHRLSGLLDGSQPSRHCPKHHESYDCASCRLQDE